MAIELAITYKLQEQKHWCWAACAAMICESYDLKRLEQRNIAAIMFGDECARNPSSAQCNKGYDKEKIIKAYINKFNLPSCKLSLIPYPLPILYNVIFKQKRPVQAGIIWGGGRSGHTFIIHGVCGDIHNCRFLVSDPLPSERRGSIVLYGKTWRTYQELITAYGLGRWSYSIWGFPPLRFSTYQGPCRRTYSNIWARPAVHSADQRMGRPLQDQIWPIVG